MAEIKGPGASRGGRAYRGQDYPAGVTGISHPLFGVRAGKLTCSLGLRSGGKVLLSTKY